MYIWMKRVSREVTITEGIVSDMDILKGRKSDASRERDEKRMTDSQLLELYRTDPERAAAVTADAYYGYVFTIAAGKLSGFPREDAEEVADDVLLRFWREYERVDLTRGSVKAYICLLAQSMALNRRRELTKNAQDLPLDEAISSAAEDSIEQRIRSSELLRRVSELPEIDRKAVLMRYFYGLPHRDIAERLGLSDAAVRKKIERALKKLGADKEGLL